MQASAIEAPGPLSDPYAIPLEALDPSDARLFRDNLHHAYFRRLRAEDPVHWSPTGPSGPYWSITRFNDIVAVETDVETFSSRDHIVIGDQDPEFPLYNFLAQDPPVHGPQRRSVTPAVTPSRLAELEALIRERTAAVLDGLPVGEEFNWVERVSIDLTTKLLATLFAFPWEERHLLPYWTDIMTANEQLGNFDADENERRRVMGECLAYFTRLWRERAEQPPALDFVSLLAHNPATRHFIDSPDELMGNISILIVGGNDTTRNSMTGSVIFANEFPAEFAKLRADPALVPAFVSEVIRYQTPVAHMRRTATRDVEFGGKLIRKGDRVVLWYVSGNRDATEIEAPDRFIVDREKPRHHLSFGYGIHRCMGNRVAEMQLRILWEEILKRFSRIEVVGTPKRELSNFILGYQDLVVRIAA